MNRNHRAQYMILLGSDADQRALLFNGDHRYLAEVIDDDGMVIENLVKSSRQCPTPRNLTLGDVVPPPAVDAAGMRCFALS